jgi:putative DNA primase/helicase
MPLTDVGNAQRLVTQHGNDIRCCRQQKQWLIWDGRRWTGDRKGEIIERAKATTRSLYARASVAPVDESQKLAKWALTSQQVSRIKAMVELAQSEPKIVVLPEQLDREEWVLNVANGTL